MFKKLNLSLDTINSNGEPQVHPELADEVISPSADYREGTSEENCGNCCFFEDNTCAVWNAKVKSSGYCDTYEKKDPAKEESEDNDEGNGVEMSEITELYCSDTPSAVDNDGLIWKTVLRTGSWRYRPESRTQRPIAKPIFVTAGNSTNTASTIGMADIVDSFNSNAIDHVTIPLSHNDKVDENTGYVKSLKIEDDPDRPGQSVLRAALKFTEPEIEQKVRNGSIANTSVGLFYDYIRKDDGKKFGTAMKHIALTNSPWINGMTPFGMSEETEIDVNSLEFETEEIVTEEAPEETPVEVPAAEDEQLSEEEVPRKPKKEDRMPKFTELEGLSLTDDDLARVEAILTARDERVTALESENTDLSEEKRIAAVDARIDELKDLGLSEQPGFLKTVRKVLLADTGENTLTLSEDGKEETITVSDAVNQLIDALPTKDGRINFGEQAENLGTGEKPANDAEEENKTAEVRLGEAEDFLYGKSTLAVIK